MPSPTSKEAARKSAFAARKLAHGSANAASAMLRLQEIVLQGFSPNQVVAAYIPIRTEISPLPVMESLAAQGVTLVVPVVMGAGQALQFARWTPDCAMVKGAFGAKIPADPEMLAPDIIIAPLVAFDRRGFRLGYGGGFYDRSFEELRAAKPVIGIGLAYAAQEMSDLPTEPTDQPLDVIVTERETIRF